MSGWCTHEHLSRVYSKMCGRNFHWQVCLDCGREWHYDLKTMRRGQEVSNRVTLPDSVALARENDDEPSITDTVLRGCRRAWDWLGAYRT